MIYFMMFINVLSTLACHIQQFAVDNHLQIVMEIVIICYSATCSAGGLAQDNKVMGAVV